MPRRDTRLNTRQAVLTCNATAYWWLFCICFVSGGATCAKRRPVAEFALPVAFTQTPTLQQLIDHTNRSLAIQRIESNTLTITSPGLTGQLNGNLQWERPHNFNLQAYMGSRVLGTVLAAGSNRDIFWLQSQMPPPPTLYYARHDEFEAQLGPRRILPVSPLWLREALGIVEFDPTFEHEGPLVRSDNKLEVRSLIPSPRGPYHRVVIFSPKVTGKPIHLGGSLGRVKATGRGVFVTGREAARRLGLKLDGVRVAVQGFGNVGSAAAELFVQAGAKIVAVQDHTGTIVNEGGLDLADLMPVLKRDGGVGAFTGAERSDDELFWDVPCDILIPAALEGVISAERARRITARLVLEGANGPTVPEADDILAERGVLVVPDVICNAGGVTVSYFEWVQDFSSFFWSEDEINVRLDKIMVEALKKIWETADRHKITLRTATFAVACERILFAREERGLYP